MGFQENLAVMKKAKEAAEQQKKEAAEKATAEKANAEKEAKRGELSVEREKVAAELNQAEQDAGVADAAFAEATALAEEMGENLPPDAKMAFDAMSAEVAEAKQNFERLKSELERIDAELGGAEGVEPKAETTQTEALAEAAIETAKEETTKFTSAEASAEVAPETATVEASAEKSEAEAIEAVRKDDEAVETFIRLRGWKGRMNKSETEQMEYIKNHPEKISEYTGRIKENIPTLDEKRDKILFKNATDLAKKDENFRQTIIQRLIDRGIIKSEKDGVSAKEASPVLREMEKEIISTPRKDSAGRMHTEEERYPLQLAGQHYEELQSYFYQHERNLTKLGKEGEGALISVIDNYLDGVEKYLDYPDMVLSGDVSRGLGHNRPLSRSITQSFDTIERDLKNIADPETKQAILQRVVQLSEKAKKIAKSTENSHYVQEHYDSIVKKISKEK